MIEYLLIFLLTCIIIYISYGTYESFKNKQKINIIIPIRDRESDLTKLIDRLKGYCLIKI